MYVSCRLENGFDLSKYEHMNWNYLRYVSLWSKYERMKRNLANENTSMNHNVKADVLGMLARKLLQQVFAESGFPLIMSAQ